MGSATGYARAALLYIEPDSATLAVVDTADGSITDVHRELLPEDDDQAVAKLLGLVSAAEALEEQPEGVLVVGSGVDIPLIKPALEGATSLPLSVPEQPDTALARGAALASANAPLFASSTAALAYALDPGTGSVSQHALEPGYLAVAECSRRRRSRVRRRWPIAPLPTTRPRFTPKRVPTLTPTSTRRRLHHRHVSRLRSAGGRAPKSHTVFGGDERVDHFCCRRYGTGDFAGVQHPTVGQFAAQPQPQRGGPGRAGPAAQGAGAGATRTRAGSGPGGRSGPRSGSGCRLPLRCPRQCQFPSPRQLRRRHRSFRRSFRGSWRPRSSARRKARGAAIMAVADGATARVSVAGATARVSAGGHGGFGGGHGGFGGHGRG